MNAGFISGRRCAKMKRTSGKAASGRVYGWLLLMTLSLHLNGAPTLIIPLRPYLQTLNLSLWSHYERRIPISDAINAADFLYSELVPFGPYLQYCTGIMAIIEEGRKYLYASCAIGEGITFNVVSSRHDITDCAPGTIDVTASTGFLNCNGSTDFGSGNNLISQYIPRGNYLLTCTNMKFYPCRDGGRLEATCRYFNGNINVNVSTSLSDGDSVCKMGNRGFITNVDGDLSCDPEQTDFSKPETEPWFLCD